jgi:CHAT domain-containing protein
VLLPRFGKERVLELQRGGEPEKELGGWQLAYCFRGSKPALFRQHIDQLGGILWEELWQPVLAKLQELGIAPGAELVWFPHGGSGPFPMHSAWRIKDGAKQWFTETYTLRYAPSLKTLVASEDRPAAPASTLLVTNPSGDLEFAPLEAAWVRQAMQTVHHLSGADATKQNVMQALASATQIHLATHAEFHLDDPLQSSIKLVGGEQLTLQEFAPLIHQHPPAFIVLSGCETAMARVTSMADEFLGFPAALLSHGARVVLASQWWVDDAATAFLVGRFYKEYASVGTTAAEALRRAQNWLRTVTTAELSELLRELMVEPGETASCASKVRTDLRNLQRRGDKQPFAHPFYWAAFTISGGSK